MNGSKPSDRTLLRMKGIELVNECKPVLTNIQYIKAINKATSLFLADVSETGEVKTLGQAIFGESSNNKIEQAMFKRDDLFKCLTDDSMPLNIRIFFANNLIDIQTWEEFTLELVDSDNPRPNWDTHIHKSVPLTDYCSTCGANYVNGTCERCGAE